jgi:hypothetical protein
LGFSPLDPQAPQMRPDKGFLHTTAHKVASVIFTLLHKVNYVNSRIYSRTRFHFAQKTIGAIPIGKKIDPQEAQ